MDIQYFPEDDPVSAIILLVFFGIPFIILIGIGIGLIKYLFTKKR
jgi:hypothetical protein